MQRIITSIEKSTKFVGRLSSWLIIPLCGFLCYEVMMRYLIGKPTAWSYDITYMLYGALFLLCSAYTLAENAHLRIDIFYNKFSPRIQGSIDIVLYLIVFLPVIYFISSGSINLGFKSIVETERSAFSPWKPIMWPFRAVIAISFILLFIQGIAEIQKALIKIKKAVNQDLNKKS